MKLVTTFLGILLFSGMLSPLSAQIRENEASVAALAVQCSISSGFSADDYEDYCRRLAKTLGMLSGEQQTRVFGYLPQPVAAASSGSEAGALGAIGNSSSGTSSPNSSNSGTLAAAAGSSGGSAPTETNALVNLVGGLNSLLDGNAEVNATVVAGTSGDSFASATAGLKMDNSTAEAGVSAGSRSSGSLSDFLVWLSSLFSKS